MNLHFRKNRFEQKSGEARRPNRKRKKTVRIAVIAITVVAVGLAAFASYRIFFRADADDAIQTARVTRRDVSKTIEGSGTIAAVNQYDVTSLVKGEILADYIEEGQ